MSGMRTHMEVAGRMLDTYLAELDLIPDLPEFLRSYADLFVYGAAYPDWTHATDYAVEAAGVLQQIDTWADTATAKSGIPVDGLVELVESFLGPVFDVLKDPPPVITVEPEHWEYFLRRYLLLLRSGGQGSDIGGQLAIFLGMTCHDAQDNVFHFAGATDPVPGLKWLAAHPPSEIDLLPQFRVPPALEATIRAVELETGERSDHGGVEMLGDLLIATYPTYVSNVPKTIARAHSVGIESDVAKVYVELGVNPPVPVEGVDNGRNFIDLYLTALSLPQPVPGLLTGLLDLDSPLVPAAAILRFSNPKIYSDERNSH